MNELNKPKSSWMRGISKNDTERGLNFFKTGKVDALKKRGRRVNAIVHDDKDYRVSFQTRESGLENVKCSCKKCIKRKPCRHVAAVLFKLVNRDEDRESILKKDYEKDIETNIDNMSLDRLKNILREAVQIDAAIADKVFFAPGMGDTEHKYSELDLRVEKLTGKIINENKSKTREIDDELKRFTQAVSDNILRDREFKPAFDYIVRITDAFDSVPGLMKTKAGKRYLETMMAFWNTVLDELADRPFRQKMIQKLRDDFASHSQETMSYQIAKPLLQHVAKQEAQGFKGRRKAHIPDVFPGYEYNPVLNAHKRLRAMWDLGYPDEEIETYKAPFRRFPPILEFEDDFYSSKGEYHKAEAAILRVLSYKDLTREELSPYYLRLAEIYRKSGETEKRKEALKNHIESIEQTSLEAVNMLKELLSQEDWERYILSADPYFSDLTYMDLLMREDQREALFEKIKNYEEYEDLSKYDAYLLEDYGLELEALRMERFKKRVQDTKGGEAYTKLVMDLEQFKVFPNAQKDIRYIVQYWRTFYKRKIVLMEELEKFGY